MIAVEWRHCARCTRELDINFQGETFLNAISSETMRAVIKVCAMTFIEVDVPHQMEFDYECYNR